MRSFLILFSSLFVFSAPAFADIDYGLEVGIRQQSGDVESGASTKSQMGLQFGATAHFPLAGPLHLRTGMLYTQRPLILEQGTDNKVTFNSLDVPVALMYKFEEYAGVFAGVALALNLDKSIDRGTVENVKSPFVPFILGASFKFAPQLGVALYYESGSGEIADGLKDYRAVGANLMITFD